MRRAFLCGDGYEHRQRWLEDRIQSLAQHAFSIDVLSFAVMNNHLHAVVRTRPDQAAEWTATQVAERWAVCYPRRDDDGQPLPADPSWLEHVINDQAWIAERRLRLASVSWFMRLIKEPLARMANREDGCTGAFWEGRFHCSAILDQAGLTAVMAYVDLNRVRAKAALTPETSDHTSIKSRIEHRQQVRKDRCRKQQKTPTPQIKQHETPTAPSATQRQREDLHPWLTPISRCIASEAWQRSALNLDEYLTLVDETGRLIATGKRGVISHNLRPILARLDIDLERWLDVVTRGGYFLGTAIGSAAARAIEATRRGAKWIVDQCGGIFKPPPKPIY